MVEEQALDRVYRIGQKRNVKMIRYIVKDSIEEVSKNMAFNDISTYPKTELTRGIKYVQMVQKTKTDLIEHAMITHDSNAPMIDQTRLKVIPSFFA